MDLKPQPITRGRITFAPWYVLGFALLFLLNSSARALPNADQVKAAYLFNFAKYSKWAEHALPTYAQEFRLCVVGHREVTQTLEAAGDKLIKERKLTVLAVEDPQKLTGCHLVYWDERETRLAPQMRSTLIQSGALLVGEGEFTEGIIGFVEYESKIGFVVNLDLARAASISMSAQLLKLAIATHGKVEEEE